MDERDEIDILYSGPWGVKWTPSHGDLGPKNPLMYTCAVCKCTSGEFPSILNKQEKIHEPGCRVALMCALGM